MHQVQGFNVGVAYENGDILYDYFRPHAFQLGVVKVSALNGFDFRVDKVGHTEPSLFGSIDGVVARLPVLEARGCVSGPGFL